MNVSRLFRRPGLAALLLAGLPALAAEDRPVRLDVDAREAPRKILHARLTIPARPGALTLAYPKWIPGEHGPTDRSLT